VILAHYAELDWVSSDQSRIGAKVMCLQKLTGVQAASYGIEADLVRFSVGLEKTNDLVIAFRRALAAIPGSP
jgi:cystathionine gamma-synthase